MFDRYWVKRTSAAIGDLWPNYVLAFQQGLRENRIRRGHPNEAPEQKHRGISTSRCLDVKLSLGCPFVPDRERCCRQTKRFAEDRMDTHKNARLTPEGREEMVCAVPEVRTIRRQARLHTSHPCIPAYAGNER